MVEIRIIIKLVDQFGFLRASECFIRGYQGYSDSDASPRSVGVS